MDPIAAAANKVETRNILMGHLLPAGAPRLSDDTNVYERGTIVASARGVMVWVMENAPASRLTWSECWQRRMDTLRTTANVPVVFCLPDVVGDPWRHRRHSDPECPLYGLLELVRRADQIVWRTYGPPTAQALGERIMAEVVDVWWRRLQRTSDAAPLVGLPSVAQLPAGPVPAAWTLAAVDQMLRATDSDPLDAAGAFYMRLDNAYTIALAFVDHVRHIGETAGAPPTLPPMPMQRYAPREDLETPTVHGEIARAILRHGGGDGRVEFLVFTDWLFKYGGDTLRGDLAARLRAVAAYPGARLFFPLQEANHWTLLVYDQELRVLYHLDSLPTASRTHAVRAAQIGQIMGLSVQAVSPARGEAQMGMECGRYVVGAAAAMVGYTRAKMAHPASAMTRQAIEAHYHEVMQPFWTTATATPETIVETLRMGLLHLMPAPT